MIKENDADEKSDDGCRVRIAHTYGVDKNS